MWNSFKERLNSSDSYISMALGLAAVLVVGLIIFNRVASLKSGPGLTATPDNVTLPTEHTVVTGEHLWGIAEKYFKSGYNWVDIAKANALKNPDYITEGEKLTIPDVKPIVVEQGEIASGTATQKAVHEKVTVKEGDTLWAIAGAEYNDSYRWTEIAKANNLANPDYILPGQILTMP